jgi:predicted ATPase/DNA-binding SARP family transcriptional activator
MGRVEISLLGPLEVRTDDGRLVDLGGARLRRLLIRLALDPGRAVGAGSLVDAVWGDEPPANAANALQALVSRLRRAGVPVDGTPGGYQLSIRPEAVDATRFARLVKIGRAEEALALWRGEPVPDAEFAAANAVRWRALKEQAQETAHAEQIERGEADLAGLRALAAEQPVRDKPVELLMRALHRLGRDSEALAAYERHREVLADELGADPSPSLQQLHVEILRAEPQQPRSHGRTNLPAGRTSFLGRDDDVAMVRELVGRSRLTTLTGPGGSGKTRLSIESARGLLDAFPDGVWLVELAPLTKDAEVAQAVVTALGARVRRLGKDVLFLETADPVERLISALGGQRTLIVLDNCEHLIDAAAHLADDLLAACPGLRVLATSREPLGITGEALWPVEPLALPPADADVEQAMRFPVVQLLDERARAVRPDFRIDADAVSICRALDGMPLAIELAAARLRTMTARQLTERLDDKFRLLRGGSRTALPRHQTLRAVIDWSWDLLGDDERRAWQRLAVPTSWISIELAEAMLGADAVELVGALLDKSLLRAQGSRYRMLETVREYGLERLTESGDEAEARKAWMEYFVGLSETAEPHLRGADQLPWLRLLEEEHDNVQSMLRWAIAHGLKETALRLIVGAGWYWWLRGFRRDAALLVADALALPGDAPDHLVALTHVFFATTSVEAFGDFDQALKSLNIAVELTRGLEYRHPMLRMAEPMQALLMSGLTGEEHELSVLERYFDDPDPWCAATARAFHGHAVMNLGRDRAVAEEDFAIALAGFRAIGDRWGLVLVLDAIATIANQRGDYADAVEYLREAIGLAEELNTREDMVQQRMNLAWALWLVGDETGAAETIEEAARVADEIGLRQAALLVSSGRAQLARLGGDLDQARRILHTALAQLDLMVAAPQFRAMLGAMLGIVLAEQGDLAGAARELDKALQEGIASADSPIVALVLIGYADLAVHRGDMVKAATLLGAAAGVMGAVDHSSVDRPRVEAAARAALGPDAYDRAYARGTAYNLKSVRELTG